MTTAQYFVYKRPVAWTALVGVLVWGVYAYNNMPQRHDPIIPVRSGVVMTSYPGASAEKVEQEVTRHVERRVAENSSVEKVTSVSRTGLSLVFVDLFDREQNSDLVWHDLEGKLASMSELPSVGDITLRPELNKDFGDTVAVMLTISSSNTAGPACRDGYTHRELRQFADLIQDRLKQSPNVGKIEQVGVQDEVIHLFYSDQRLSAYDISPAQIAQRLQEHNINQSGGRVELDRQMIVVKPSGEFLTESEIGEVVVDTRHGYPVYMRDLVDIVRQYEDPPNVLNFRTSRGASANTLISRPAITLAIRQIQGQQVSELGRDIDRALESLQGVLPDDLVVERTSNEPEQVQEKVHQFIQNLIEAIVIVVVVALVFMEWRSAVLVAFSIPLTVAMTLGICHLLGIDLQQVSIAALIISLGLLVDDPVVAGDAINRELAMGVTRDVAAWQGPQKLSRAILFATLTNCVAFLPLLLVSGKTGEFIYSLPVVVTVSLICSRIVSMTFMPLLGYYILKGQRGFEAGLHEGGKGSKFARYYNGFSEWCLAHKWVSLSVCLTVLLACLAAMPLIGISFFPKDVHAVFTVNVYLPEGAPIRQTRHEADRLVEAIERLEGNHIRDYTTFVGAGGPRFWLSVVPEQRIDNYAQILVRTSSREVTEQVVCRLKRELPQHAATARITIEQLESGPPVGVPVQVRIFGSDLERLRGLADETKNRMREIQGTDNIHDDWEPEILQIALNIKSDKASLAGISHRDIANIMNSGLSGYTPTHLRDRDQLIPITFRLRDDERGRIDDLESFSVTSSSNGARVPLSQIATVDTNFVSPKICRRNHERCLTVKCDALPGVLPSEIVRSLQRGMNESAGAWPPGYRFEFGGEREEQEKGFASVAVAFFVSLAAIYGSLVVQFNSVTKPLVVFAAVPFGLAGGMMGLLAFGAPFGFMAFLGIASLAGVIVSHIIVLFDYIEEMHEHGEPLHRAVIDAALVRLRPVLVTVLATVGGLIPLAIEGGPLWQPMCYVQIVGLLAATLVTKVVVPVLYVLFVENLKLIRWDTANSQG